MYRFLSVKPTPRPSNPSLTVLQTEKQCLLCQEHCGVCSEAHKIILTKCLSKNKS